MSPQPNEAPLTLRTLGDSSLVASDAKGMRTFELSKALALVVYLASAPGHTATREHLIDLLWSGQELGAGRKRLRQTIWLLRSRFRERLDIDGKELLVLRSRLAFDRADLIAAAEAGDHQQVCDLYAGEFMPGFASPGAGEFESWLDLERARLRSIFLRCAEARCRVLLGERRIRDAQLLATRVRDMQPLNQQGWRLLLECILASGDRVAAHVEADALTRLLQNEDIDAEPTTRALLAAARKAPTQTSVANETESLSTELVGREREFAALLGAWEDATQGRAICVHVTAPTGAGKTRLLDDFRARLQSLRARVVHVRANPGASRIAEALAGDLAGALATLPGARGVAPEVARTLVRLNPTLSSTYSVSDDPQHPDETRQRMFALRELIVAVSEERPFALLVDDLHWSDPSSRLLLTGAFGALERQRVLLVVSERRSAGNELLLPDCRDLPLAPLSLGSLTTLLSSVASLPSTTWANALPQGLLHASGGSPLLALETLQLAMASRALHVRDGAWETGDPAALVALLREGGALRRRVELLGAREREILEVLSIAGRPLPLELARRMCVANEHEVIESLLSLERAGIVARHGEQWSVAHDAFGDESVKLMAAGRVAALHVALGRAYAEDATDPASMRMAATHLRYDRDTAPLASLFLRYLDRARTLGDRRPVATIAAELLSASSDDGDAISLSQQVPWSRRLGLAGRRRLIAASVTGAAVAAAVTAAAMTALAPARRPESPPDAVLLVRIADSARGAAIHEAPLYAAGWQPDSAIVIDAAHRPRRHLTGRGVDEVGTVPGELDAWTMVQTSPDSGVTDIYLVRGRREERLTFAAADDMHYSWAPDGSRMVFATSRWSALDHTDIAMLTMATGEVRQFTSGDASEEGPSWSPDGTRIAFLRRHWDGRSPELCVVAVSGGDARCETIPRATKLGLGGWLDESTLLASVRRDEEDFALYSVSFDGRPLARFGDWSGPRAMMSPDGRWVACQCTRRDERQPPWRVFPTDAPKRPRDLRVTATGGVGVSWAHVPTRARYLDSLVIGEGQGAPIVGVPYQLLVHGLDARGRAITPLVLAFHSSDTTVAIVHDDGIVHARRPGTTTITADAGGWRSATRTLRPRRDTAHALIDERWQNGIGARWIPFGAPRPTVVEGPGGIRAMRNGGDGRFSSGIYSADTFDVSAGLSLEATLSARVTLGQWQVQNLSLLAGLDTRALAAWDHMTGYLWSDRRLALLSPPCQFQFPAGTEGAEFASLMLAGYRTLPPPAEARDGRWLTVRMQWFPDGACGVAVDGEPVALGAPHLVPAQGVRAVIYGNSFRTDVLVGPLTLFRGVRRDIDWSRAPREASRPPYVVAPRAASAAPRPSVP